MAERIMTRGGENTPTSDPGLNEHRKSPSLWQEVMDDPKARRAYFEPLPGGTLYGNPKNEDVIAIREKLLELREQLQERSFFVLFTPNRRLPRPQFVSSNMIRVGREDIEALIVIISTGE